MKRRFKINKSNAKRITSGVTTNDVNDAVNSITVNSITNSDNSNISSITKNTTKNTSAIEVLKLFDKKPLVTVNHVCKAFKKTKNYARLLLYRLHKRQLIKRLEKNKYTTHSDVFVIASNIVTPAYISFWTASMIKGFTEQVLNTVFIATTVKKQSIVFNNYKLVFVKMAKKHFFGFEKKITDQGDLFIANNEKLLIDCFLKPKFIGNFSEILKILNNADISKDRLIEYLRIINNKSLYKRIGFLMETYKGVDISTDFKTLRFKDRNYVLLNPLATLKKKRINAKWRVVYANP